MAELRGLAQSAEAVEYATARFFQDGAIPRVIAEEVEERFGIKVSDVAVRGFLWRRHGDFFAIRGVQRQEEQAVRAKKIYADAVAGLSIREIVARNGVSTRTIGKIVSLREVSPAACTLRKSIIARGPAWMSRPIDPSMEGNVTDAGKLFEELADDECRFPVGKDADGGYRFCGVHCADDRRLLRRPYCAEHGGIVATSPPPDDELLRGVR